MASLANWIPQRWRPHLVARLAVLAAREGWLKSVVLFAAAACPLRAALCTGGGGLREDERFIRPSYECVNTQYLIWANVESNFDTNAASDLQRPSTCGSALSRFYATKRR